MSEHYRTIAVTDDVRQAQSRYGSRAAHARSDAQPPAGPEPRDALELDELSFIAALDGFYLASVSETGWPYVQFRGGPPGFAQTPDEHTIAWADFRGNRQYISTGNIQGDDRVSLFFMDYPNSSRLKVYGRARIIDARDDPALAESLAVPGYPGIVERVVSVTVVSYDWNCPQHITPRYSAAELNDLLGPGWQGRHDPSQARQ